MIFRTIAALVALITLPGCHAGAIAVRHTDQPAAELAWQRLHRDLPGDWVEVGDYKGLETTYRSVSRGSTILETFGHQDSADDSDRQTLSVYHQDLGTLMVTHYCAQGNQARLRSSRITGNSITFDYIDATNLSSGQSVLDELTLTLAGTTLERIEVYRKPDGGTEITRYRFNRVDPATASVRS